MRSEHSWLNLDKIKEDCFRGECLSIMDNSRAFGGQVLAQAMSAAYATIPTGFLLNSFHCYFIRAGEEKTAIIYEVKRLRNGRNFAVRTVEAIQYGRVIHTSEFSFQNESNASKFKVTPKFPEVPAPEALKTAEECKKEYLRSGVTASSIRGVNTKLIEDSLELRPCDGELYTLGSSSDPKRSNGQVPAKQYVWIKYRDPVGQCFIKENASPMSRKTAIFIGNFS